MITSFSAVVLAAGRSTRMGSEKALLRVGDCVLWRRQCELLREAGASEILLSARADQRWAEAAEVIGSFDEVVNDAEPDRGPLGGVAAALARAQNSHLAVLAIDLPRIEASWFRQLALRATPGMGVVGRRGDFFEPLAALYPKEMDAEAQAALRTGRYSMQWFIADGIARGLLREVEITSDNAAWFENWNERKDGRSPER